MNTETKCITEKALVDYLNTVYGLPMSKKQIEKLRARGQAPMFRKWGRNTVYYREDIDNWVREKLSTCYKYTMSNYSK